VLATKGNIMSKTVLITGTSSGLGRATAKLFSDRGWNVIATMRSPESERELTLRDNVLVTRLDVQDQASITAAVASGLLHFGRIDALINNAGYGAYGPLEVTPLAKIRRQFDVNVLGVLATTQALLPHFRQNHAGVVVNVSSIGGRVAFPLGSLYHGAKFALEGLSEALQYELGAIGVRIKVVEPGGMATDFGGRSFDFNNDPSIDDYSKIVGDVMGAFGSLLAAGSTPELIAETVFAAANDETDTLRFEAGADAVELLATRRSLDDASFFGGIKAQFGMA
jgi:NAD(P)-dependent dehydrogenase (short-subunit alcohol dehydrogenase family)